MHKTLELLFGRVYELNVVNQPHRTRNMTKPVYVIYSFNHVRMNEFADSNEAHRFLARVNAGYTADLYYLTCEAPQVNTDIPDPLLVLFATNDKAEEALRSVGFALIGGIWKSKDGLIDAYVKVRSDGQYRIELHA